MTTALMPALLLAPLPGFACAVCFGKSDEPLAQGMNMGIFTLLIVVLGVLLSIAVFFAYILRRAARMSAAHGVPGSTPAASGVSVGSVGPTIQ